MAAASSAYSAPTFRSHSDRAETGVSGALRQALSRTRHPDVSISQPVVEPSRNAQHHLHEKGRCHLMVKVGDRIRLASTKGPDREGVVTAITGSLLGYAGHRTKRRRSPLRRAHSRLAATARRPSLRSTGIMPSAGSSRRVFHDPAVYTGSRHSRRRLITTNVMSAVQSLSGQIKADRSHDDAKMTTPVNGAAGDGDVMTCAASGPRLP
jgi:hypothetical protein